MNKKVKRYVALAGVICLFLVVAFSIRSSLADTKTFTRTEMRNMVVATAVSYENNRTYSNYEQKKMDNTSSNYSVGGSFAWRTLNVNPEMVNRAQNYAIDCSSFAAITYLYSLGYDFSEFYKQSESSYVNNFTRYTVKNGSDKTRFVNGYSKYGTSINTLFYKNIGQYISGVGDGKEYINTSETNNKIVAYHYNATRSESTSKADAVKANIKKYLQRGDILVYRTYNTSTGDTKGHAMVYIGDYLDSSKGFIHSTGSDYIFDPIDFNEDDYSVRYDTLDSILAKRVFPKSSTKKMDYITILRPINKFCEGDSCKISTLNSNAEARADITRLRVEQYSRSTKAATNGSIGKETTAEKSLSKYNSINKGEEIEYRLYLENKSIRNLCIGSGGYSSSSDCKSAGGTWRETNKDGVTYKGMKITNVIPENTTFKSCNYDCVYTDSNRTVTWTVSDLAPKAYRTYSYTVTVGNTSKITNNGMKLKTPAGTTLKLASITTNVHPTLNTTDLNNLNENITKFKNLVAAGKIKYDGSSTSGDKTDLDTLTSASISQSGFVRSMYYNTFGIDIDYVTNSNVKAAIFDNKGSKDYAKKTSKEVEALTNEKYININKMLVKGLYGGRYLRGNDAGDRPGVLRVSDLEVGDIVMYYTTNNSVADTLSTYIYLGTDGNSTHYFVRYESDNGVVLYSKASGSKDSGYEIFKKLYTKNLFVVLRPTQLYGTTVKFNYNGGSGTHSYYTAYNTYRNLVKPTSSSYTVKLNYNKTIDGKTSVSYNASTLFSGWYTDKALTNKVTNSSSLSSTGIHTLYAKYAVKLPKPTVSGYNIDAWYSDSALTKKVGEAGDTYTLTASGKTLYAKWIANKYTVKYDANGGTGTMSDSSHAYGVSAKLNANKFTKAGYEFDGWSKTKDGEVDYLDEGTVRNLTTGTGTVTLYAVWREKVDTDASVSVKVENGTTSPARRIVTKGNNASFTLSARNGYGNPKVSCTNSQTGTISGNTLSVNNVVNDTVCTVTYEVNKYSIKFDANGGTGTMNDIAVSYGEEVTLTKNTFTRGGYEFRGWALTSDGSIEFIDESTVKNLTTGNENVTLYAVWSVVDYSITYELNEGKLEDYVSTYNAMDENIVLGIPVKTGYEFTGWTGSNGETPQINVTIPKGTYGNLNYVANWEPAKFTVTYKSDDKGVITGKTEEIIAYGGSPTGTTKTINEGFYELKWAVDKNVVLEDGKTIIKRGQPITLEEIQEIIVKQDLVITAYHYKNKYKIKYNAGDNGAVTGISDEEVAENGNVLGTEITPKKGYVFAYWVADKDVTLETGEVIASGNEIDEEQLEKIVINQEIQFRAEYNTATYGITYLSDSNGVITGITEENKEYQENPTGTTTAANDDYMFLCWIANVDVTLKDGTVIKSGDAITNSEVSEIVVDDNIELTAVHVKEILKVFYKGSDGIVIGEVSDEEVAYGANPTVVKYTQNNTNRNVVFVVDRDVYLKDGKKITKGTKMSLDQFKQVSVEDDLIVTIMYGEVEEIVNVPDTSMFGNNAGIIGGLLFIVFGICIFYGVLYRKQESN